MMNRVAGERGARVSQRRGVVQGRRAPMWSAVARWLCCCVCGARSLSPLDVLVCLHSTSLVRNCFGLITAKAQPHTHRGEREGWGKGRMHVVALRTRSVRKQERVGGGPLSTHGK